MICEHSDSGRLHQAGHRPDVADRHQAERGGRVPQRKRRLAVLFDVHEQRRPCAHGCAARAGITMDIESGSDVHQGEAEPEVSKQVGALLLDNIATLTVLLDLAKSQGINYSIKLRLSKVTEAVTR